MWIHRYLLAQVIQVDTKPGSGSRFRLVFWSFEPLRSMDDDRLSVPAPLREAGAGGCGRSRGFTSLPHRRVCFHTSCSRQGQTRDNSAHVTLELIDPFSLRDPFTDLGFQNKIQTRMSLFISAMFPPPGLDPCAGSVFVVKMYMSL